MDGRIILYMYGSPTYHLNDNIDMLYINEISDTGAAPFWKSTGSSKCQTNQPWLGWWNACKCYRKMSFQKSCSYKFWWLCVKKAEDKVMILLILPLVICSFASSVPGHVDLIDLLFNMWMWNWCCWFYSFVHFLCCLTSASSSVFSKEFIQTFCSRFHQ